MIIIVSSLLCYCCAITTNHNLARIFNKQVTHLALILSKYLIKCQLSKKINKSATV